MSETGVGIINPMFFIGVVENNLDPRLEGRVQVRAFGVHGTNDQIPTQDLPWATLIIGSHDINFVKPPINSWVFGFFVDGRDAQQPMVLGLIPTQMIEPINPAVTGWGTAFGREVDLAAQGSRPQDVGQPRNSKLDRGEQLQDTYIPSVETNRVRNIPIAGGASASFSPKGNTGVASQDESITSSVSPSNIPTGTLKDDKEFQSVLAGMKAKYPGLTEADIYRVIQGESGFNPRAINQNSGAAGLFQFIPEVANELGTSTTAIQNMSPADQLRLYDRYLERWDYKGGGLGIMQAAPAFADRDQNEVIYAKGSPAWQQNPGWRTANDGDITVASINAYYAGQPAPTNPSWNAAAANASVGNAPPVETVSGSFFEEPAVGYNAKYPYNRVIETAAGHSVELDDTPGSERIMIYHKSGSYIQITNTSTTRKSMEDAYDIMEENFMVYVGGTHALTIEGDSHVLVKGNKIEEIMGDYKQIIHGNHSVGIAGQGNFNASEEIQMRAARLGFEANVENINLNAAKQIKYTSVEEMHFKSKNMFTETSEGMNFKSKNLFIGSDESVNIKSGQEFRIMSTGKVSLNTQSTMNLKSAATISIESSGITNLKSTTMNIESSATTNIKAGGPLKAKGSSVYIDGSTVYLDDFVSMANGVASANPPAGAGPADPTEPEEVTPAKPATEVKLGEPPSKEIAATPATTYGPQ